MARNHDLVYMTSSSSGTPFSTSTVTGYNDFQDFYAQNELFIASFKDGSDNYATGWCHLDGSNNVVVDEYLFTSTGAEDNTEPTFSGTVDIVVGAASVNTHAHRPRGFDNFTSSGTYEKNIVLSGFALGPTNTFTAVTDELILFSYHQLEPGWYYQFATKERNATTGDYRVALYDIGHDGNPTAIIMESAARTHGGGTATANIDLSYTLTITAISKANPAVVTYTGTDPSNGQRIFITDVVGMTEVNNRSFIIANVNAGANTFELKGEDSTAHTTYSSAGTVHFPVFVSPGEYAMGWNAGAAVATYGYSGTQLTNNMLTRAGSNFGRYPHIKKGSTTFGALPAAPLDSGTWSGDTGSIPAVGLVRTDD